MSIPDATVASPRVHLILRTPLSETSGAADAESIRLHQKNKHVHDLSYLHHDRAKAPPSDPRTRPTELVLVIPILHALITATQPLRSATWPRTPYPRTYTEYEDLHSFSGSFLISGTGLSTSCPSMPSVSSTLHIPLSATTPWNWHDS